jgi:hypothetical protein
MACYCDDQIRYKGRLITVHWRYCHYMSFSIAKGKDLVATKRDERNIQRLGKRKFTYCGGIAPEE